ncbi:hypothetical protein ACFE04_015677 [Oxalis oulophora]
MQTVASAIKSRFGYNNNNNNNNNTTTPDLTHLKSASRETVSQSSVVRNLTNWDDNTTAVTNNNNSNGSSSLSLSSSSSLPPLPPSQSFDFDEDPSFWNDHNVQVIIRVRPLSTPEISVQGYNKCVKQESSQTVTWTGPPESRYTFDLVADEHVSQEKLFNVAGVPMVENCVKGYNSCMFAYGQTGSGKTHTMLGDIEGGTRRHSVNCGMTPRVFEYLFTRIQKEKEARKDEQLRFICKCSFLEIYNEQILDLLDPSTCNLHIREDIKKGVHVENLKEIEVNSARDVIQQLIQGAANRKVAATNMNRASSRSHSVFTCIIESKWESQGVTHHRFARLNLVDLAGSERQKSSGAEGERLKEATNINKSLSTLGLVIMNLVSVSNGKPVHVPYRDSKLTFLLQDSLGGNSKTTIIANISPSICCSLETLSTLKFAQRAKFIKNNAIVNEDASGDVIAMRLQIQQLKKEVSRLQGLANGGSGNVDNDTMAISFPASPGSFNWEGIHGSFSPLACDNRKSMKKDYEVALVGAFRREKEKDSALQALAAENQLAIQLKVVKRYLTEKSTRTLEQRNSSSAKQREDELQGLKMRLRFREAGIKRLEAVALGKVSVETHLLKEKEEYQKEIKALRNQVDRNPEVTRFAMENLQLKEEIRRLKSFCEEGERDMLNEQIMMLQNKLLEALDWKLMHEPDLTMVPDAKLEIIPEDHSGDDCFLSEQKPKSPRRSSINVENDFLRTQAIQNQAEMDTLHKRLEFCIEEKVKLERQVDNLVEQLEEERTSRAIKEDFLHIEPSSTSDMPIVNLNDQMELKTMVDAISAASEREAAAHETAIKLSEENDKLRLKLNDLLKDNERLIGLYEKATAESHLKNLNETEIVQENCMGDNTWGQLDEPGTENENETNKKVEDLEHQLIELHEENEKLLSLYENAMLERDEYKRIISDGQNKSESSSDLNAVKTILETAEEKLSDSSKTICNLATLEKSFSEIDEISKEIDSVESDIQFKQQQISTLKIVSSEMQERKLLTDRKLSALRYSLSNLSSSLTYFEQREARAKSRVDNSLFLLAQKKEELTYLHANQEKTNSSLQKIQQSEVELRNSLALLKAKLVEESQRSENDKVLFAIDNIEKMDPSQRNCLLGGNATGLLKTVEEKKKLQNEINEGREKLGVFKKELDGLSKKSAKIDNQILTVQMEIEKGARSVEEMEFALENVVQEKQTLLTVVKQDGKSEIDSRVLEYTQHVFDADLKEAELNILKDELEDKLRRINELQMLKVTAAEKIAEMSRQNSGLTSEKVEELVQGAWKSVMEAKTLLAH